MACSFSCLAPNLGAGVLDRYRARRRSSPRDAAAPIGQVRRSGRVEDVANANLVPGDVVLLRTGDVVIRRPALIAPSPGLRRSVLTGASLPEPAAVEPDPEGRPWPIAAASPLRARPRRRPREGVVIATGLRTEFGRISQALAGRERRRSPLQREMAGSLRILLVVAIGLIVIVVGLGFLRGQEAGKNLLAGVSAAIAAIPRSRRRWSRWCWAGRLSLAADEGAVRRLFAQDAGSVDPDRDDKTGP